MKYIFLLLAAAAATQSYAQCACCAGAGAAITGAGYGTGTSSLKKNGWNIEAAADSRAIRYKPDAAASDEVPLKSMLIASLGVHYGITQKIAVSGILPYTFLHTDAGNDRGIGDLVLLGSYNAIKHNGWNFTLQAGVELPTGVQKGATFDNTTVVVGSGSFDPMAGLGLVKQWNKMALAGNMLYKYTTTGFGGVNFGSLYVHSMALSYNVAGQAACDSGKFRPLFSCNISCGYYGEQLSGIDRPGEGKDPNTGYYLGFATAGTMLSYSNWSLPLTISVPFIQRMNGDQNDAGLRMRIGVARRF